VDVPTSIADLIALARSPGGTKMIRYTLISVIAVAITFVVLGITNGLIGIGAFWSNIISCGVATFPSYELNRKWAWGKSGKSHFWKEVAPFWGLAFLGLAFSTWAAVAAESVAKHHHLSHLAKTGVIEGAVLGSYGVLWIGKFIIFNEILFKTHPQDLEPALDGRTGIPG
jgi:putative flippase GtrA